MTGDELRDMRQRARLTQADLGKRIDTHQATISNWERGTIDVPDYMATRIEVACGVTPEAAQRAAAPPIAGGDETYGEWVARTRVAQGLSRQELADKADLHFQQIYLIETNKTLNPRMATRRKIETALQVSAPTKVVKDAEGEASIAGVGTLTDFDPHSTDDHPDEAGVYVFYDISDRPIYVGQSSNIKRRIREHHDKFWFKSPIVEKAAFVRIDDKTLRGQIEAAMIKFLKSNAVINRQSVERN